MAVQQTVKIEAKNGLHARPVTQIVSTASKLQSEIKIIHNGKEVNAKSMLGVMGLGVRQFDEVTVVVEGENEEADLKVIVDTLEHVE